MVRAVTFPRLFTPLALPHRQGDNNQSGAVAALWLLCIQGKRMATFASSARDCLTVTCRLPSRALGEFAVLDISLAGCMIERRAWTLKDGERLLVKLPGLEFQPATVVWTDEEHAGIAFESLLYEPILLRFRQMLENRSDSD